MKASIMQLRQDLNKMTAFEATNTISYLRDHLDEQDFHDLTKDLTLPRSNASGCFTLIVIILTITILWI